MYQNETTNKFSREIPLENILLQINTMPDKPHYFEIRTEQLIYYCGYKRTRYRVSNINLKQKVHHNLLLFYLRNMI